MSSNHAVTSVREAPKVVSLATALAALTVPAGAMPITDDVAGTAVPRIAVPKVDESPASSDEDFPGDVALMGFTVHQGGGGMMFPQHSSHSSHSSHASHASHASGGSWGVPNIPDLPSPYVPPAYVPPAVVAPAVLPPASSSPATEPAPATGVDLAYIACTRARNGFGVNDISQELQGYGLGTSDAISMATQALTAVLGGGHFCDSYHGD